VNRFSAGHQASDSQGIGNKPSEKELYPHNGMEEPAALSTSDISGDDALLHRFIVRQEPLIPFLDDPECGIDKETQMTLLDDLESRAF
jgi:hypothetical protein